MGAQPNTNSTPGISRRWSERILSPEILNLDNQASKKINIENESEALNEEKTVTEDADKKGLNLTEAFFFHLIWRET